MNNLGRLYLIREWIFFMVVLGSIGCGGGGMKVENTAPTPQAALQSITISPSSATLTISQTQRFAATGTYSDGSTQDLTQSVTWNSSNPAVVYFSAPGYAVADAAGSVTITSTAQAALTASASASVTYTGLFTYHNDLGRTGQNLNETTLTPSNVNSANFGKLFSYQLPDAIYAQPLYVRWVPIPHVGVRNVIYVVTAGDIAYAYDADGKATTPYWQVNFTNPSAGVTTVPALIVSETNFAAGYIGITGTPVIDPVGSTLYLVTYSEENGQFVYRLHALDLATGVEKLGGPVVIQATVSGTGDGNSGQGQVPFSAQTELQRPGLALVNGIVYIGFGSHADTRPWHGWLLAYDATTLKQVGVFNATPNAFGGAIWAAGGAPAADASGNIYVSSGNGIFDASAGGQDYGDSILKLQSNGLGIVDWFTPFNQAQLSSGDLDLGSGAVMLLPDQPGSSPHLLLVAGKEGRIYLLDRDDLGQFNPASDPTVVQELVGVIQPNNFSTPAYWQNTVYFASCFDTLKMFTLTNGLLSATPVAQSPNTFGYCGATPSVSANRSTNGVIWAVDTGGVYGGAPSVLHAYDATNVSRELYNSTQAGLRDTLGIANRFAVPTVINGKVYVPTATELDVLGLLGK